MPQKPEAIPAAHGDGTLTGVLAAPPTAMGAATMLDVDLPAGAQATAGHFMLARCGVQSDWERRENWQIYLRRPLFVARAPRPLPDTAPTPRQTTPVQRWSFTFPTPGHAAQEDPGFHWLQGLEAGAPVNLLGPLGQPFALESTTRNLLLNAIPARLPALLPMAEAVLDRGGRVTLLLGHGEHPPTSTEMAGLVEQLPLAMEVTPVCDDGEWRAQLEETVRWADQLAVALPRDRLLPLAELVRRKRFRLEPGFAQALVEAELACGIGACLACVVPLAGGGHTRACVHGPAMDLARLA